MTRVTLYLEPSVARFYRKIADSMDLPLEKLLSDALFKLAGELALESLAEAKDYS